MINAYEFITEILIKYIELSDYFKLFLFGNKNVDLLLDKHFTKPMIKTIDNIIQDYFEIRGVEKSIFWSESARIKYNEISEHNEELYYDLITLKINIDKYNNEYIDISKSGKLFKREHVTPVDVHVDQMVNIFNESGYRQDISRKSLLVKKITDYINKNYIICLILQKEDALLENKGLRNIMPISWNPNDGPWIRYKTVGIKLSNSAPERLINKNSYINSKLYNNVIDDYVRLINNS